MPPLFHGNKFITDFKEKAELFDNFFLNQYSSLRINYSVLPADAPHLTYKRLDSLIFLSCDIAKIISHIGHDIAQPYSSVSEWGNYVEIQFIILFQ